MKRTFAISESTLNTVLCLCRVSKIETRQYRTLGLTSNGNCHRSLNKTPSIPILLRSSSPVPGSPLKRTGLSWFSCPLLIRASFYSTGHASSESKMSTKQSPPIVVCVEGNIGCGKTTLLNYFQNEEGCEILAEPVEKWRNVNGHNALALMYKDPLRWSMTLQTYIQLTMVQNHARPQTQRVKLMERSIYSAKYCFTDNLLQRKMTEFDHVILTQWFDWIIQTQNVKVDLIVYLRTNPEVLYSRILERCRPEEKNISLEYLTTLHQLHEDWLIGKKKPCPAEVLVIDANSSVDDMVLAYEHHKGQILQNN